MTFCPVPLPGLSRCHFCGAKFQTDAVTCEQCGDLYDANFDVMTAADNENLRNYESDNSGTTIETKNGDYHIDVTDGGFRVAEWQGHGATAMLSYRDTYPNAFSAVDSIT